MVHSADKSHMHESMIIQYVTNVNNDSNTFSIKLKQYLTEKWSNVNLYLLFNYSKLNRNFIRGNQLLFDNKIFSLMVKKSN